MNGELRNLLEKLRETGRQNDLREREHSRKMLNLDPQTAEVVHLLLCATRRKRLLEIGTSNGYSTIWIAEAMRVTGGKMTSIDRDAAKHVLADENLRQAGLRNLVELHLGEASELVERLSGPFDCIFFDADRVSAPDQLTRLLPKLTPDGMLLADNALSHREEIAAYLEAVAALADFDTVIIPVGKGLSVAYRGGDGER